MYLCPSCKQPGIGVAAKRWSSRASPAQCTLCERHSHVIDSVSGGIWTAGVLLIVAGFIAAAIYSSPLPILSGVCLVVAHNIWAWRRAEMFPITLERAKIANKVSWVVAVAAVFSMFFS